MNSGRYKILLIEDNASDARLVREILSSSNEFTFDCETADRVSTGLELLAGPNPYDAILLDLSLPDSRGDETFDVIFNTAPDTAIIIFTEHDEKEMAERILRKGAQDYWNKDKLDPLLFSRGVGYAIQRQRMRRNLETSLSDLRESEARYRLLADNSTDTIWMGDLSLNWTYVSPSVRHLRGFTAEETLSQSLEQTMTQDSIRLAQDALSEELAYEGTPQRYKDKSRLLELEFLCKDGSTIWTEAKVTFIRNENDEPVGMLGVTRDISERKIAEEKIALRNRELSIINQVISVSNSAGSLKTLLDSVLNKSVDLLRLDCGTVYLSEKKGQNLKLACSFGVSGDFLSSNAELPMDHDRFHLVIQTGKPSFRENAEQLCRLPDESGIAAHAAIPILAGEQVLGIFEVGSKTARTFSESDRSILEMIGKEIGTSIKRMRTEVALHEEETRYRKLFESSTDAIMLLDETGFFDCNQSAWRIFGFENKQDFIGVHPYEVSPPVQLDKEDSKIAARRNIEKAIQEGQNKFQWLHKKKSGEIFFAEVWLTSFTLENRKVVQATVRDISERIETESRLSALLRFQSEMLETAAIWIDTLDQNGSVTFWNKAAESISGYSRNEVLGNDKIWEWLFPKKQSRSRILKEMHEVYNEGRQLENYETVIRRKDGQERVISWNSNPLYNDDGIITGAISLGADITARKKALKDLRAGEERFRNIVEFSPLAMSIVDTNTGQLEYINSKFTQVFGYTLDDIPEISHWLKAAFPDPKVRVRNEEQWKRVLDLPVSADIAPQANDVKCKDGSFRNIIFRMVKIAPDKVFFICEDITGLMQVERALRSSEERFRSIIENSGDLIYKSDLNGKFTYVNPVGERLTGYAVKDIIGKNYLDFIDPDWVKEVRIFYRNQLKKRINETQLEFKIRTRQGEEKWVSQTVTITWENENAIGFQAVVRDITDRIYTETALKQSEERYRRLTENAMDMIWRASFDGTVLFVNPAVEKMMGYTVGEAKGLPSQSYITKGSLEKFRQWIEASVKSDPLQEHFQGEVEYIRKDGKIFPCDVNVTMVFDPEGKILALEGISRDITDRKRNEKALRKDRDSLQDRVMERTTELVKAINKLKQQISERRRAEKALRETEMKFRQLSEEIADGVAVVVDGKNIWVNKAFCVMFDYTSEILVGQGFDFLIAPDVISEFMGQMEEGKIAETGSFETMATKKDGTRIQIEVGTKKIKFGNKDALQLIVRDITKRKESERELQSSLNKLRKAMSATIQAMAMTIEMRDPYTAGHQNRVTQLALAIANELDLSKDQCDALRMAGVIHDLGKISIPSEILSKPGQISDMIFNLIKIHPQVGYEILRNIDFPWPVAEIVYQHHERMDGSGYPRGLVGEEILLEARVLAVADVVEAVASHRPYRPALGIDRALEEIELGMGTLFDEDVVRACLRIFKQKSFQFDFNEKQSEETSYFHM